MTTRMLIDARHREETRVAVIKGNRIEEFDFESAEHKQLKGNIYLAKVTRVEPSLQAAFVEYGGNRHGFLAFSEIHPDYYQIPKEDREALIREEAEHAAAEAAMRAEEEMDSLEGEIEDVQPPAPLDDENGDEDADEDDGNDGDDDGAEEGEDSDDAGEDAAGDTRQQARGRRRRGRGRGKDADRSDRDEAVDFRRSLHRRYKIQDVIRRRQVLLVQVVKEERGTKGAALTSYLSLAGRYCVLMPNSSHGGGISRKISNNADRKRLKSVIDDLNLPTSMGCIVRTAGLERTKTEIKRDFDYLARLWDEIRERTLSSSAPALIHSDSDLIKRAIRDIYNSGIEEVLVEGDEGYRAGKDFMKLLMPSHARRVKQYADPVPLFQRYGVEDQLGAMYQPLVPLKSGGYLVINPTEALVSIDINSGRSTREHNIEQTALSTNLEAAYEIARQLRLRDMAGLVVIDFIDMEMGSNVRKVERAMRDALKNDRARIQVGRISGFGLMEMSRQRLRTGVLEASTRVCPHCEGTGLVRTASSAGLSALRLLEEEGARGKGSRLTLRASQEAAFYVLNNKRAELTEIEQRYGVTVDVQSDGQTEGARMTVEVSGPPPVNVPRLAPIADLEPEDEDEDFADFAEDEEDEDAEPAPRREREREERDGERGNRRRRRRRGRRDGEDRPRGEERPRSDDDRPRDDRTAPTDDADEDGAEGDAPTGESGAHEERGEERGEGRRRRRGRRGGRNRRGGGEGARFPENEDGALSDAVEAEAETEAETADAPEAEQAPVVADEAPAEKPRRRRGGKKAEDASAEEATAAAVAPEAEAEAVAEAPKRKRASRKKADAEAPVATENGDEAAVEPVAETPKPKRRRAAAKATDADSSATVDAAPAEAAPAAEEAPAKPARAPRKRAAKAAVEAAPVAEEVTAPVAAVETGSDAAPATAETEAETADEAEAGGGDRKRGWWQRTFGN
jgi:ribonuclease E